MADTDKLKTEYVEIYNRYMTLPEDSKELKTLAKKLQDMEQTLTRRFLFESGYATEKKGEYCIFVKEQGSRNDRPFFLSDILQLRHKFPNQLTFFTRLAIAIHLFDFLRKIVHVVLKAFHQLLFSIH